MTNIVELRPKNRTYKDALKQVRNGDGVKELVELAELINHRMLGIIEDYDEQGLKGLLVVMTDLLAKLCLVGEESNTMEVNYTQCEKMLEERYVKRALEAQRGEN
jgi:hypothetical protein